MAWYFLVSGTPAAIGKALKSHEIADTDRPQFESAKKIIEAELRAYVKSEVLVVKANGHVQAGPEHDRALTINVGPARP